MLYAELIFFCGQRRESDQNRKFSCRDFLRNCFRERKMFPWEEYIPKDGKFWVAKAASVKSKLFSPSDIQSIMKKAMVDRLKSQYEISWFPEDGEAFRSGVFLMKDEVTVGLDSTGESLHKRGYRKLTAKAPIAENLAASLIMLTP